MRDGLPFGAYLVRVAVPLVGVLLATTLLVAAVLLLVFDIVSPLARQRVFAAGVITWILSVAWGVIVNGWPPPARPEPPA